MSLLVALAAIAVTTTPADAQVLTWDPNGASAGTGGNGSWDTTSLYWTGTSGTRAWPTTSSTSNDALFAGTSGTVTVQAGGVNVNEMTVSSDYTFTGGLLNFSNGLGAGTYPPVNSITVSSGATMNLRTTMNAYLGFSRLGSGTLVINGNVTVNFGTQSVGSDVYEGLTLMQSGTYTRNSSRNAMTIGTANGGSFIQTGGNVNLSTAAGGFGASLNGFYGLYSGALTIPFGQGGANSYFNVNSGGVFHQRGGSIGQNWANVDQGVGVNGVLYATGGTASLPSSPVRNLIVGSTGLLAITGSAQWAMGSGMSISSGGMLALNGAGDGVNGGRLTLAQNSVPSALLGTGSAAVSFDGGILRAGVSTTTFMQGFGTAQINALGATIDSQGFDITIAQNLSAPTGSGLTSIALTGSGSGYIGAPQVRLSGGGGSGATAVAEFDYTTGQVTGITITSPGSSSTGRSSSTT